MDKLYRKFTGNAVKALETAQAEADAANHRVVDMGHLLLGIAAHPDKYVTATLLYNGLDSEHVRQIADQIQADTPQRQSGEPLHLSDEAKRSLTFAMKFAQKSGDVLANSSHLLAGWQQVGDERGASALNAMSADFSYVRELLIPKPQDVTGRNSEQVAVLHVHDAITDEFILDLQLRLDDITALRKFLTDAMAGFGALDSMTLAWTKEYAVDVTIKPLNDDEFQE